MKAYKPRTWENDVIHHVKSQRNTAYIGLAVLSFICLGLIVCLMALMPLKRVEPAVIEVEKSTGNIRLLTNLTNQIEDITAKEAVIKNLIANYIIAWHTYEYTDNDYRYNLIQAMSTPEVWRQYENIWRSDDPNINPNLMYKEKDTASVRILSIIPLNEETYQTRFVVKVIPFGYSTTIERHFVATTKHKISPLNMEEQQRWKNPIGLLFSSVRFDEEFISEK